MGVRDRYLTSLPEMIAIGSDVRMTAGHSHHSGFWVVKNRHSLRVA
jgi:hypothetical protein